MDDAWDKAAAEGGAGPGAPVPSGEGTGQRLEAQGRIQVRPRCLREGRGRLGA